MSTGTTTQSSLLLENQSVKQDASQSALHYLFQEVSKITSPIHNSFMETESIGKKYVSCHESVPHIPLSAVVKNVQSPLKVLSLINLQCERLLDQSEDHEVGHSSLLFLSDFGCSKPAEESQDTAQPLNYNSVRKSDIHLKKDCRPEDCETIKSHLGFPVKAEGVESTADTPQTPELRFSVGLDLSSDWTKECLSIHHTFYDFLPEPPPPKALYTDNLTFSPNEENCAAETLLPLDHNANICLNSDELPNDPLHSADTQFYSQVCSSLEQQPPHIKVNTASMCEDSTEKVPAPHPVEQGDKTSAELTSVETRTGTECEDQCTLWRSKRRKQSRPSRSASVLDPDFQGVTFRMDTELDDTREQCRLRITSQYRRQSVCILLHKENPHVERRRRRYPTLQCLWDKV
ncbi:GATA-type zinc finger protein 1 isoform X2 [Boleophthalmus pectinirostris]|uniref:GATA-type zinc finger protein 1 isoform X2 n=1 Tax=Boleophthalmus pectinirostris TaxID=150288 RepID=UPI00242E5F7D|nr:GATA-type zinc finger protein 1 isoform X2 [Boleophthalmus pectinirostris]